MTDKPSDDGDTAGVVENAPRTRRETVCESNRSLNVLLIDDNPMNQQSIGFMVDRMGHETSVAENGRSGIEMARNEYFDIILMDINLTDMNGMEAARQLRADPGISGLRPILAITSDAEPEHRAAYKAARMDGCIEKPVNNGKMARVFDEVMGEALHTITERNIPLTAEDLAREAADNAAASGRDDKIASFLASLEAASLNTDG
ncbi:MAG: response regulator [Rhodospirillales bacterium]|nr:response regulator [Rhodospirillales bacterium]